MNPIEVQNFFHLQKRKSWEIRSLHIDHRISYLHKLKDVVKNHEPQIIEAFQKDYQKPALEVVMTEIYPVLHEIQNFIKHLHQWAMPQSKSSGLLFPFTSSEVLSEPKGTCLIIAPWNYPFGLALTPLVGAIGAGNTAIIKPSELTPAVSQIIADIVKEVFPSEIALVIQGGKETSQALLDLPFDHIFFTGSNEVGKIVMAKAAQNLTSVTLELGGKSPSIIDEKADLKLAAEKIIWGKTLNNGQTCVAPDYILIHENSVSRFIAECESFLKTFDQHQVSNIISNRHRDRLTKLEEDALQKGAKPLLKNFVSILQMNETSMSAQIMKEEIFGPLLPLITYEDTESLIHFIIDRPKPLALYIFSKNNDFIEAILKRTSSGGACINDTIIHVGNHALPFGGVGESGIGSYHGKASFQAFSHQKSIMKQGLFPRLSHYFYPPYTETKLKLFRLLIKLGF